jgi:amino acid adenylation domain-containing protein
VSDTLAQDKELSPLKRALVAVQDLTAKLDAARRARHEPIAIIGMACRFPGGANDPARFWTMLRDGREGIGEVPADRWDIDAFYDADPDAPGKMYTRTGGFLDRPVDRFDARFFGIAPREASGMDPQQRLLLELAWEGLEDAAITPDRVAGSRTGVFVGIAAPDFNVRQLRNGSLQRADAYSATGNAFSVAAGRISYLLGLQGPNLALDTACSSSLVAVAMAVQSLRDGHADMALAGGVNLMLAPETTVGMCKLRALAPDGRCKTFDAAADGYVRGEGGGLLVLKRLSDALAAGDRIRALVRGVAVNHDGRSSGLTVPNASAQQAVIRAALADAGLDPDRVDYLEAHGTGTELGDPIELRAAHAVLGRGRDAGRPLVVGSVKTNVGHVEAAAGIAGIVKTVLSLEHEQIPPHLHLENPTPHVDWDAMPVVVPTAGLPWPRGERPRVGAVSSFGFSGTNAHVVLEEAPVRGEERGKRKEEREDGRQVRIGSPHDSAFTAHDAGARRGHHLLPLSAKSEPALRELAGRYAEHLAGAADPLVDICHTAGTGRAHFEHRLAVVGASAEEVRERLLSHVRGAEGPGIRAGEVPPGDPPKVAFLFTGQGAQYIGMGRQLWETEPRFRATLERCDALLRPHMERPLLSVLFPAAGGEDEAARLLEQTAYTQPALFALEYALADLWQHCGIRPHALLGHSVGEYVAACIAGVFTLEEALELVAHRGRLMQALPGGGAMAAVFAPAEQVEAAIRPYAARLSIAAHNAPENTVVSGDADALDRLLEELGGRGVQAKRLRVSHAFHSPRMEPVLEGFRAVAERVAYRAPRLRVVSNRTGQLAGPDDLTRAEYWVRHLREPVRFRDGIEALRAEGVQLFLEVGPGTTLLGLAQQCLSTEEAAPGSSSIPQSAIRNPQSYLPSLRPGRPDGEQLLESLGALYTAGVEPDWSALDRHLAPHRVGVPTYPFQGERHWPDEQAATATRIVSAPSGRHPLLGRRLRSPALREIVFGAEVDTARFPLAGDHRVFGATLFPATGYVEAAIAAAGEAFGWEACEVADLTIREPLVLDAGAGRLLQVILAEDADGEGASTAFRIASAPDEDDAVWTEHARGRLRPIDAGLPGVADIDGLRAAYPTPRDVAAIYDAFHQVGIEYGPGFRGVRESWAGEDGRSALARLEIAVGDDPHSAAYRLHPGLLDAGLQTIAAALPPPADGADAIFLPTGFGRLRFTGRAGFAAWAEVRLGSAVDDTDSLTADLRLCDDAGRVVVEIHDMRLTRASRETLMRGARAPLHDWLYRAAWRPVPRRPPAADGAAAQLAGTWLLIADAAGVSERLAERIQRSGGRAVVVEQGAPLARAGDRWAVDPDRPDELGRAFDEVVAGGPIAGVVHLAALDEAVGIPDRLEEVEAVQRRLCSGVLELLRGLDRHGAAAPAGFWLFTRGAQQVESVPAAPALAAASLWGLGRTIVQEYPGLRCRMVDLDPDADPLLDELVAELGCAEDGENQVALRAGGRYAMRLVPHAEQAASDAAGALPRPSGEACALEIPLRGTLENLELRPVPRRTPGPGEVEVRVEAAGLNFRDVLNALGSYPGDPGPLGGEMAGEVVRVGAGVTRFRPGDRVFGMGGRAFGDFVTTRQELVGRIPAGISAAEAATLPIAYLTALRALRDVGGLRRGERVLIHAAAGGVGLAALQVARAAGAEVIATAGSERKRRILRGMGVERIFDSRSTEFADRVLEATDGRGVDVVLNSLNGEFIPAGFRALARGGRFLELGKIGIWTAEQAAAARPDVGYHVIDLIRTCVDEPETVAGLLADLLDDLGAGRARPLPLRVYPMERAPEAFRSMAQARHIGKLVLANEPRGDPAPADEVGFRRDATYLVTGGLGGLGLAVARWMAERGAGRIALLGRGAPTDAAAAAVAQIEALGAEVVTARADVADMGALAAALGEIEAEGRPLRGVVHAAGVLDDATLPQQQWERFVPVLAPKVAGALNLHRLTADRPLDHFLLFSSVTSILGSAGQANYAVANAFLDALAAARRSRGLPAQSINWAAWGEVGMAAERGAGVERRLAEFGIGTIAPDLGCRALGEAMRTGAAGIGVLPIQRARLASRFRPGAAPPLLSELLGTAPPERADPGAPDVDPAAVRRALASPHDDERLGVLIGYLRSRLARVLGLRGAASLDPARPLAHWGIDSLMVVELRNAVLSDLGIEIAARDVFDAPDLAALAARIDAARAAPADAVPPLVPVPRNGPLPLSFAQHRLWFLQQMDPASTVFNIVVTVRLRGPLDAAVLERGLGEIVRRHEVLRTVFVEEDGTPRQIPAPAAPVELPTHDLSALPPAARSAELRRSAHEQAQLPFDLRRGPLLRASLLRLAEDDHALLLAMHHIATDGWSTRLLVRELGTLYAAFRAGTASPLPEPGLQYADFAQWQPAWLGGGRMAGQLAYWKERLADLPTLQLPTDRPRPPVQTHRSDSVERSLSEELSRALARLGRDENATPFMVLLAAFQLLLGRLAGQDDVVVGSPVAGRERQETEALVGFFVNNLVLRTGLAGEPTFRELVARVRETTLGAYANQDVPFEHLVEELNPPRDLSRTPLFQVMFNLLPAVEGERQSWGDLVAEVTDATNADAEAKFDLTLFAAEGERFRLRFVFNSDLFDATSIERLADGFATLLEAAVADPARPVGRLPIVSPAERQRLVEEWNATDVPVPDDATLADLFAEQVARTPDAPALTFEGRTLTYAELDGRANRLAWHLQSLGVGPESRVAVVLERSHDLVVAILGVLRAGGAWVPVEPDYPADRIRWMLDDSAAPVLLTRSELAAALPPTEARVVRLDTEAEAIAAYPAEPPPSGVRPENLAYLIYTSGSTGRPKGAMIEHRGVVNRLLWQREAYGIDGSDVFLQKTPIGFDVSVWETFVPLISGAHLVVARPGGHLDPDYLVRTIEEHGVTSVQFVPSVLRLFLDALEPGRCASLRQLFSGGEALPADLRDRFLAAHPAALHNLYGPTETSGAVTRWSCERGDVRAAVPIGRPVANTRAYVLDGRGELVPVGVAGELHIGGVQVGRGYLGRPDLTAERFVPDPFSGLAVARLYRTGDRVRWLADGALEYLGRTDDQVKLRGVRIEPGEVESALRGEAEVRDAAVVALDGDGGAVEGGVADRLVAYVVLGAPAVPETLRRRLAATLPAALVPAAIVEVDAIPLNPHGKLDRRALAGMAAATAGPRIESASGAGAAPRTPLEELVAGIWQEVLGVERVGVHDGFYDLGGHSLLAMQVTSRLRRALDAEVPLRLLFEAPSVAALAARLELLVRAGAPATPPLEAAPRDGETMPLSFAQQRLWFLQRLDPAATAYNLAGAVRLDGDLDADALERSFADLVSRHETLRTVFEARDGEPRQRIHAAGGFLLDRVDLRHLDGVAQDAEIERLRGEHAARPFDLARGPLLRAALLSCASDCNVLLVCMHHIVTDGWSVRVLLQEMAAFYAAHRRGEPAVLPLLPLQYADFAVWQRRWLRGAALESQLGYWRGALADLPALELPTDRPRPAEQSGRSASLAVELPAELSEAVRRLARQENATLFMTLLAALQALLARLAGQDRFAVGAPIAGRTRPELEGLIGFFVNTLALRADLSGDPGFRDLLARVRETTLGAYAHQDLPFEKLVEELAPARDLSRTPIVQVLLNMLPDAEHRIELDGLGVETLRPPAAAAKFDFTLYVAPADRLRLELVYAADLFDESRMEALLGQYVRLLEQVTARPDLPVSVHELAAGGPASPLPDPRVPLAARWPGSVLARLRDHAARTPDVPAASDASGVWSYRALDEASSRVAAALRAGGIVPGDVVAVHAARRATLPLALLGVWKAGAAFTILDAAYPPLRLAACLRRSGARGWIELGEPAALAAPLAPAVDALAVRLEIPAAPAAARAHLASWPAEPFVDDVGADDLAYVAFTSGTTGEPRAIVGTHRPLAHFLDWHADRFGLHAADRFSVLSGLGHDPLLRDLFAPLWVGATACVPDAATREDLWALAGWLRRERITVAHLTPAMGEVVIGGAGEAADERLADLRFAFFGGDLLRSGQAAALRRVAPAVRCVGFYGATETPQAMAFAEVDPSLDPSTAVPLGAGIEGVQLLVLGPGNRLCGVGEPGEVCVRTPYLSGGYLGEPALTAERFVANPFTGDAADLLYRTGDRGRYRADGSIEFAGRADDQVKIRGYRVEPGEVETVLRGHPAVRQAAVATEARDNGDVRLLAFFVADHSGIADRSAELAREIRSWLAERLPSHMVPSEVLALESLPLTPNGKVDRRAMLAATRPGRRPSRDDAPRSGTERVVAAVWRELLGRESVGRQESFFDLGGHSLLATQLVSRVRTATGVELPVRAVFEAPTVAALAARLDAGSADASALPPVEPVPRDGPLPLSFAQQRMWFLDQLEPGNTAYNIHGGVRLLGPLDAGAVEASLDDLVRRHESLRTVFRTIGGEPAQVVLPDFRSPLQLVDLAALDAEARAAEVGERSAAAAAWRFDLAAGPLIRCWLLRLADDEHVLLMTLHHIVADGWSLRVLTRELRQAYTAHLRGETAPLPALAVQYGDFAVWQRRHLPGALLGAQLGYWTRQLAALPLLELPTDRPRPATHTQRGAEAQIALDGELSDRLRELSRREGATPFMTLLAGFQVLLGRLSGQDDFAVGTPIAGRTREELEPVIGFFLNNLVLRADLAGDPGFTDLLTRVRETTLGAFAHQDVPFESVVEALRPPRHLNRTPLFQVLFNMLPGTEQERAPYGDAVVGIESAAAPHARFDLTLYVLQGERIRFRLVYNADLFDAATAESLLHGYEMLLRAAAEAPHRRISTLPILAPSAAAPSAAAREVEPAVPLLPRAAGSFEPIPADVDMGSIPARFAEVAARWPDAVAVETALHRWTYTELEARASQVARAVLRRCGAGDARVALLLGHDAPLVAAALGVLFAGKTCVPLDPGAPAARLRRLIEAADATLLVADAANEARAGGLAGALPVLRLEEAWTEAATAENGVYVAPGATAYLLPALDSAGEPMAVTQSHRNLLHHVRGYVDRMQIGVGDRVSLVASADAGAAVVDLWSALLSGATLCPVDAATDAPTDLPRVVAARGITVFSSTPTVFRRLLDGLADGEALPGLRAVVLGGEEVVQSDVEALRRHFGPGAVLVNRLAYPECVLALHRVISAECDLPRGAVPVGRADEGVEVMLLNEDGEAVETLATGEIVLRSEFLSPGYRRRPEATAASFHPDPEGGERRLFRTGDLGRRLPDGSIVPDGRRDGSVRLGGLRIGTPAIERQLRDHPAVAEAAVLLREADGERRLVAYLLPRAGESIPPTPELRAWLRERLPDAMVPAEMVAVSELPRTRAGRLDPGALPSATGLAASAGAAVQEAAAPATPAERLIAGIWGELLGVERIGVNDNFYDLGGHSLLAVQFATRFRDATGARIDLRELTYQTLGQLAASHADLVTARTPTVFSRLLRRLGRRPDAAPVPGEDG